MSNTRGIEISYTVSNPGGVKIISCTAPCNVLRDAYGFLYTNSEDWLSEFDKEVSRQYPNARRSHEFCFSDPAGTLMQVVKYLQRKRR